MTFGKASKSVYKCLGEICFRVNVSQPAAWIPLWSPAALAGTAPPPICNTEHRGGSQTAGHSLLGATTQVNDTFVKTVLPSLITKWSPPPTPTPFSFCPLPSLYGLLYNPTASNKKERMEFHPSLNISHE